MAELAPPGAMTLHDALQASLERCPDQEAVVIGANRLTYRELGRRAAALATGLQQLGLAKGDRVALLLPNCTDFASAIFAVSRAGGVSMPLNPVYRRREIQHILADSEASAAIFAPQVLGNDLLAMLRGVQQELPHLRHLIVTGDAAPEGTVALEDLIASSEPVLPPVAVGPDDLLVLMYTSGTTGVPKAIMHTHRSLLSPMLMGWAEWGKMLKELAEVAAQDPNHPQHAYVMRRLQRRDQQLVSLSPLPLHSIGGFLGAVSVVIGGARFVGMERFHPVQFLELIQRERVGMALATPTMYALILGLKDFDRYDLSSLTDCSVSTAPSSPEMIRQIRERFRCNVSNAYGLTETGGGVTATWLGDSDEAQTTTVGRAMTGAGVELKVVDEQRHAMPAGQVGELAVRSMGVMKGYYKAPEATAEVLDADGWFYTGDLAVLDEQGYVRIVGRKKELIIRGGQNIYPTEIEHLLLQHPAVQWAAAVGVPSAMEGETVWLFVQPRDGAGITPAEVLTLCRSELAPFKVPSEVRIVDELPMTPTMKVRKFALRELALQELQALSGAVQDAAALLGSFPQPAE